MAREDFFMEKCKFCQKRFILKFIMSIYDLKATDIARELNVSDSLVRKHVDGVRYCPSVDKFLINKVGFDLGVSNESMFV